METFLWQAVLCIGVAILIYLASILSGIGFARGWNFVNKRVKVSYTYEVKK